MKITMTAALLVATAATTPPLAAIAHADDTITFQSPSGNVRCDIFDSPVLEALCQIGDYTYATPSASPCDVGHDFRLDQGKPAYLSCRYSALNSGFGPWPTLNYGQTRSLGAMTCDSEPSGVTCTDTSTGHFFRVSRESYQLG